MAATNSSATLTSQQLAVRKKKRHSEQGGAFFKTVRGKRVSVLANFSCDELLLWRTMSCPVVMLSEAGANATAQSKHPENVDAHDGVSGSSSREL